MVVTDVGMTILVMSCDVWNAVDLILVTVLGIVTVASSPVYLVSTPSSTVKSLDA